MRSLLATAAACTLLVSCGEVVGNADSQVVKLSTDRATYAVGEAGVLTLENLGPHPIGPGNVGGTLLCQPELQKKTGSEWHVIGRLHEACALIGLPPLQQSGSVDKHFDISPNIWTSGGAYRFRVTVREDITAQSIDVYSNEFTVIVP